MRFSSDVLPRQPLTWAQPVSPALHLVAQHVLRDAVLELLDEVAAARGAGRRSTCRRAARSRAAAARRGRCGAASGRPACTAGRRRAPRSGRSRASASIVHRAELVDRGTPCRRGPCAPGGRTPARATCGGSTQRDDERAGSPRTSERRRRERDVDRALEHAVEAAQRHVVEADDRHAVEVLEPRAQRDELQQVGHDVDVDALAVGRSRRSPSIFTCSSSGSAT